MRPPTATARWLLPIIACGIATAGCRLVGSGKSHFMAVLHRIMQGDPTARGLPKLAGVTARNRRP